MATVFFAEVIVDRSRNLPTFHQPCEESLRLTTVFVAVMHQKVCIGTENRASFYDQGN